MKKQIEKQRTLLSHYEAFDVISNAFIYDQKFLI